MIQLQGCRGEDPVSTLVSKGIVDLADHIHWLRLYLDSRLSFKQHVAIWCSKSLKVTHHSREINSVKRGAAPRALFFAVDACVASVTI